jgi:hypothetical protein
VHYISVYLEPLAYLLYLIAVVIYHRRTKQRSQRWLAAYYLPATVLMGYAGYCVAQGIANIWVYDVSLVIAAVCTSGYFYQLLLGRLKKRFIISLLVLFLIYAVVKKLVLQEVALFDSIGYSFFSAIVAVYVIMYFHQVLTHVTETNILRDFNFWLSAGYLIYFSGSFLIFVSYYYLTTKILSTYTQQERDLLTMLWGVHNILLFASAFLLLAGSLWLTYRKKSVSS